MIGHAAPEPERALCDQDDFARQLAFLRQVFFGESGDPPPHVACDPIFAQMAERAFRLWVYFEARFPALGRWSKSFSTRALP